MATNQMKLEEPQQENMDSQDFEDMEALSLCDLPLNNKASDWNDYYSSTKEEQSSSFEHDFFEFFSEDFTAYSRTCYSPKDHIIFCGKLITYKEAEASTKGHDSYSLTNKSKPEATKRSRFFTWRSFNKSRTSSLTTKPEKGFHHVGKSLLVQHKKARFNSDFPVKKMSLLASPMKSRWYLFAFGVGRFPMEMELSDMKKRQSKMMQARKSPHNNSETTKSRSFSNRAKRIQGVCLLF